MRSFFSGRKMRSGSMFGNNQFESSQNDSVYEPRFTTGRLQNNSDERKSSSELFTIQKGIIVLESESNFERFVDSLKSEDLDAFERSYNYTSYRTSSGLEVSLYYEDGGKTPALDDVYLATAINSNGFVKVGRWLIRMIPEEARCIVTESFTDNTINEMLSNPRSNKFKQFKFTDDVFYSLESTLTANHNGHGNERLLISCNEARARCAGNCTERREDNRHCYVGGCNKRYKAKMSHSYHPYGIYHKLNADFQYKRRNCGQLLYWPYPTNIDLSFTVRFKIRCSGSGNLIQQFLANSITVTNYRWYGYKNYQFDYYSGTRALTSYTAYTSWKFLNVCGGPIVVDLPFIQSQY